MANASSMGRPCCEVCEQTGIAMSYSHREQERLPGIPQFSSHILTEVTYSHCMFHNILQVPEFAISEAKVFRDSLLAGRRVY